jgi:hypothetical protein
MQTVLKKAHRILIQLYPFISLRSGIKLMVALTLHKNLSRAIFICAAPVWGTIAPDITRTYNGSKKSLKITSKQTWIKATKTLHRNLKLTHLEFIGRLAMRMCVQYLEYLNLTLRQKDSLTLQLTNRRIRDPYIRYITT